MRRYLCYYNKIQMSQQASSPARSSSPTARQRNSPYETFLQGPAGAHWSRIGARRRAGVVTPLFAIYTSTSAGVGEYPDLVPMGRWARSAGLTLLQLLPMNDVGFTFRPYDAESSIALEPMHLCLGELRGGGATAGRLAAVRIRRQYGPLGRLRYDTAVKRAKLEALRAIFDSQRKRPAAFDAYRRRHAGWLAPYAQYKVLKHLYGQCAWWDWPEAFRHRRGAEYDVFIRERSAEIEFQEWLQWQCHEQFSAARKALKRLGVLLVGDLPFLVSRDSADVWCDQRYFKLHLAAGAPPDLCFAEGQRWGMPPYDWTEIEKDGYRYLSQKLGYAEAFYDLFRLDHFVGIFRVWTFPMQMGGGRGAFDPPDENVWEAHGRKVLDAILKRTRMLPCAEDLGTVPDCSYTLLSQTGLPGTDIQRWSRHWDKPGAAFKTPEEYRINAVCAVSTHDVSPLLQWWETEAGTVDAHSYATACAEAGLDAGTLLPALFDPGGSRHGRLRWKETLVDEEELARALGGHRPRGLFEAFRSTRWEKRAFWAAAGLTGEPTDKAGTDFLWAVLEMAVRTPSVFSIQLLQDWLAPARLSGTDAWDYRINFPGVTSDANWSVVLPVPLERLARLPQTRRIRQLVERSRRD